MKLIVRRVLAFILDSLLVGVLAFLLSYIPFLNPYKEDITASYKVIHEEEVMFKDVRSDFEKVLEDKKIETKELDELVKKYPKYEKVFSSFSKDVEIEDTESTKYNKKLISFFNERYSEESYKIVRKSTINNIVALVVSFTYFGILQYCLKGQTLMKKLMRLRVVDNKDHSKRVPLWKLALRTFIANELIFGILNVLTVCFLTKANYMVANYWLYQIQYIMEMVLIVTLILRDDGRSLHDLIFNTRVIMYDKEDKEVEYLPLFKKEEKDA